jgi:hypothetical protein
MKIIDFVLYGNTFRLYLGADDCNDYWGDDWDNVPYEHNAGLVYARYIQGYVEFAFPLDFAIIEPCYGWANSPFSKEDMKNRKVPCLEISTDPEIKIYFGDNIDEISKQITGLGGFKILDTRG